MNICLIGTEALPIPPPKGGGAEKFTYALAKTFVRLGHSVHVISLPLEVPDTELDMTFIRTWHEKSGFDRLNMQYPLLRFLNAKMRSMSYSLSVAKVLKKLYNKYHFDIVHTQTGYPGFSVVLSKRPEITHVHTLHGYHTIYPVESQHLPAFLLPLKQYDNIISRYVENFVLNKADAITAVSESLRRHVINDAPSLRNKIFTVHAMVNVKEFTPNIPSSVVAEKFYLKGKLIVLYVGRLIQLKGIKYLLHSATKLVNEIPRIIFVIVGPIAFSNSRALAARYAASPHIRGDYIRELQAIIDRNVLEKNVMFTGYVTNEELRQLYAIAHVVVVPSIWEEPCCASILEAMACGKPVVATSVGGNPELVVEGKTGMLVPPKDVDSLSNAISDLLLDRAKAEAFGLEGRKRVVLHFNWEAIAKQMLSVYEQV